MSLRHLQPRLDDVDLMLRRLDPLPGFLLEGMKDIDQSGKANGVDGPICIAVIIIDHLQYASAAKALESLGTRMLIAVLCIVDRKTHDAANLVWERPQIVPGRSDPYSGLWCGHAPFEI